jgi:hypothetical protein
LEVSAVYSTDVYTRKNAHVDAILMKTGLNSALLPTLFTVVNNIVTPDSGSTILFNIVDKCEQRGYVGSKTLFNPALRFLPCIVAVARRV